MDRKSKDLTKLPKVYKDCSIPLPVIPPIKTLLTKKEKQSLRVSIPIENLKLKKLVKNQTVQTDHSKKSDLEMKSQHQNIEKNPPLYKKHNLPVLPTPERYKYSIRQSKKDVGTFTELKEYKNKENQTDLENYINKETQTHPIHIIDETDYKMIEKLKSNNSVISKSNALVKEEQVTKQEVVDTIEIDSDTEEKKEINETALNTLLRHSESNKAIISKVLNIANIVDSKNPEKSKENWEFFANLITQILTRASGSETLRDPLPNKAIVQESPQINPSNITNMKQITSVLISEAQMPSQALALKSTLEVQTQHNITHINTIPAHTQYAKAISLDDNKLMPILPKGPICSTKEYPRAPVDIGQIIQYQTPISVPNSQNLSNARQYSAQTSGLQQENNVNAEKYLLQKTYRKRKNSNSLEPVSDQQPPKQVPQLSYQERVIQHQNYLIANQQNPFEHQESPARYQHKQTSPILHHTSPIQTQPFYNSQRTQFSNYTKPNQPAMFNPTQQLFHQSPQLYHYLQQQRQQQHLPYQQPVYHPQQQMPREHSDFVLSREQAMELQQKAWQSHLSNYPNADWSSALWSAQRTESPARHQRLHVVPFNQQVLPSHKQTSPILHQTSPIQTQHFYNSQRTQFNYCAMSYQQPALFNHTPQMFHQPSQLYHHYLPQNPQ